MTHATITTTDNGPYLVEGNVTLIDPDGNACDVDRTIALCRCGLSATKPFCDGSHENALRPRSQPAGSKRGITALAGTSGDGAYGDRTGDLRLAR
jgi:hypothetical protein